MPGVFIFIDVDNFKTYNDTYGHDNGDLCLHHFARMMKQCFPEDSILGRYGGDEFVMYLKKLNIETVQTYMKDFQKKNLTFDLINRRTGNTFCQRRRSSVSRTGRGLYLFM